MTALYIILGIIAFFVLLLSVPLHVSVTYTDYIYLSVRWAFVKLNILPLKKKEKKEKKPEEKTEETEEKEKKPEKKKKPKKRKKKKTEPEKEEGENPIITTVKNMGYDGVMEILGRLGHALGGMFKRIFKSFGIDYFDISITVGKGDAAETAIAYGKTCNKVFPVCGLICSTMKVKKYNVEVSPDFLANRNTGEFSTEFYMIPRKLINSFVIVGVELVFKVLLKFLTMGLKKKPENDEQITPASDSEKSA